ncbi:MAG TPA: exodeoxyribonuclease III [Anaerolineales bacterium]|nr:exodeoxyribonuclease III [Anaerolineales bacterium]
MNIITWNVNGIRAVLGKGALDWAWKRSPDVLCLQEVKARPEQLTEAQHQSLQMPFAWNPAERAGYSGVTTFYREQPDEIRMGFDDPKFDPEGRVIRTRHRDLILYNVYFPSGQRGHDRVDYKLQFYARLLEFCDDLHARRENIIITGDFNTAHMPIDLRHPKSNKKTSGFLPEEREWVQKFLDHGFVDIYRRLYPERVQYTWWTYRLSAREHGVGWRIDYFLISQSLAARVKDVIIHDDVPGSDHCPVELIVS